MSIDRLKDNSPLDTIFKIRKILKDIGLFTIEKWNDSGIPGLFSVRILIPGTEIGTNGKGATELLALASGYGEFMERLQNGLLFSSFPHTPKMTAFGFQKVTMKSILSPSPIVDGILYNMNTKVENQLCGIGSSIELGNNLEQKRIRISKWDGLRQFLNEDEQGELLAIPFTELHNKSQSYLPVAMRHALGSHGMAAGNTYKEAIVQAISEILERYCQKEIIEEKLTPPTIPFPILKQLFPTISQYIDFIENQGNITVEIRDCSLGRGFPVYCICIINKDTHCFSVTFGSHPNVGVALERLFTEVMQGRKLKDVNNKIGSKPLPEPYNTRLLFKISMGYYPNEFWRNKRSYEIDFPLLKQRFDNNDSAYKYYMSFNEINKIGIYIRDCGYLGFPAVHVIIPEISEVLCCNDFVLKHSDAEKKVTSLINNYNGATKEEKELIVNFADFDRKIGLIGSARPYHNVKSPFVHFEAHQHLLFFIAQICVDIQEFDLACNYYGKLLATVSDEADKDVFSCICLNLKLQNDNASQENILDILSRFYRDTTIERASTYLAMSPSDLVDYTKERELFDRFANVVDTMWDKAVNFHSSIMETI